MKKSRKNRREETHVPSLLSVCFFLMIVAMLVTVSVAVLVTVFMLMVVAMPALAAAVAATVFSAENAIEFANADDCHRHAYHGKYYFLYIHVCMSFCLVSVVWFKKCYKPISTPMW